MSATIVVKRKKDGCEGALLDWGTTHVYFMNFFDDTGKSDRLYAKEGIEFLFETLGEQTPLGEFCEQPNK